MAKQKGLGKGLGALLGEETMRAESAAEGSVSTLPLQKIEPNPLQPRRTFAQDELDALAESIRIHGVIQPLTVRLLPNGYYQIIAGERRWRAARLAGLSQVPVVVIEADDRKAMELALIENLQRADLNPIEEAEGYQQLISQYGLTQEQAAERVAGRCERAAAAQSRAGNFETGRDRGDLRRACAGAARAEDRRRTAGRGAKGAKSVAQRPADRGALQKDGKAPEAGASGGTARGGLCGRV